MKQILDSLRVDCGDSEFGYRMQALFAHIILRLGGKVLEINAKGHPDVRARLGDRELLVQVKASSHSSAGTVFEMTPRDLAGISSKGRRQGFLAFLDCAVPVKWIMVPSDRAQALVGRLVHIATLRAESHRELSEDCTEEFLALILANEGRLSKLTYHILRRRGLNGEAL